MKIFWSWQSDTDGKTGRHFIRKALEAAIEILKERKDVEEPTSRDVRAQLELDQDRRGVSGSPDLAALILEKIEKSAVFIADVTPVSRIPPNPADDVPEKRTMNPNVAIELGYAIRALSDRKVLMVLNTYYGGRQYLPFDLAHKAGPITFKLPPTADSDERKSVFAELRGGLVAALRPFVDVKVAASTVSIFPETASRASVAVFFDNGQVIAHAGEEDDDCEFTADCRSAFYLRLMPTSRLERPFPIATLESRLQNSAVPALWRGFHGLRTVNQYGAIVVEPRSPSGGDVNALTQVFRNGELWGIAPGLFDSHLGDRVLVLKKVEDTYRQVLPRYISFLQEDLGIDPPYTMEAGAVGLADAELSVTSEENYGPIRDEVVQHRVILNDARPETQTTALLEFFDRLFELTGYRRPQNLFGFPPSTQ